MTLTDAVNLPLIGRTIEALETAPGLDEGLRLIFDDGSVFEVCYNAFEGDMQFIPPPGVKNVEAA